MTCWRLILIRPDFSLMQLTLNKRCRAPQLMFTILQRDDKDSYTMQATTNEEIDLKVGLRISPGSLASSAIVP
jgi:hypothetical protein